MFCFLQIIEASKILGCFVPVDTWTKILLPAMEDGPHFGHLIVLMGLIEGAPREYISASLEEIAKLLAEPYICQSRKMKYQREMVKCVQAILSKYVLLDEDGTGKYLFFVLITLVSLRDVENTDIDISLLGQLSKTLQHSSTYDLWHSYAKDLLVALNKDPKGWLIATAERCIFEIFVLHSREAFGENLELIGDILTKTLDTGADPEARLKTFAALSSAFEKKDVIFKNAERLNVFLETLIAGLLPSVKKN